MALPLTDAAVAAARTHWGLGDTTITLIAARENRVFRVDRAEGPAAMRLHRTGYRTSAELCSELDWMAMLAEAGLNVPKPILAKDGTTLLQADGLAIDLLTWLDGAPMSSCEVTEETYHTLGQLTARMHNLADRWTPPKKFTRPTWDLVGDDPTWDRFWDNPELSAAQRRFFKAFRDEARRALSDLRAPDIGLIHADLVPDNVLVDGSALAPIDFDDGGFGHRPFDLATVTFRSRRDDPSGARAQAAINGYRDLRTLDEATLPLFEALRACTYVGWNITRMTEPGARARNTRFIRSAEDAVRRHDG